ncbi:DUF1799 domain-containing protein [Noviherbaspirillum malthae]|uniref:DUF1799 domain-containing protein n=1 Tax=Noviherbaspirillum malthae TaxID=1260987 RepID=UPI00188FC02D|nr:DUF1799 domain-containing protein [Noviherbaspirillum malthae]
MIEAAEKRLKPQQSSAFEVWEENWESFLFFDSVRTQWVYVSGLAGGVRVGLDYGRVEATMRMEGIPRKKHKALLDDLRIMEFAVLKYDGEKTR